MTDASDEATGLPPLDQPDEANTMWVMAFGSGQGDVLSPIDRSPQGCLVLGVRGLLNAPSGPEWVQMFVAVPHGAVGTLKRHIDGYLELFPES